MADSTVGFLFPSGHLNTKEPFHTENSPVDGVTVGRLSGSRISIKHGSGHYKIIGTITLNEVAFDPVRANSIEISISKQLTPGYVLDSQRATPNSTFEFYGWEEGDYEIIGTDTTGVLNSAAKATVRAIPI